MVGRHHEPRLTTIRRSRILSPARDVPRGLHAIFPGISFDAFHRKMEDNELKASVVGNPRLFRAAAFARAGLCASDLCRSLFVRSIDADAVGQEQPVAIETLQEARRDVMFSKPEHEMDLTERWIRRFALQNRQWSTCWYDRYPEIESHMFEFQIKACRRPRGRDRSITPPGSRRRPVRMRTITSLAPGSGAVRQYLLEQPPPLRGRIREGGARDSSCEAPRASTPRPGAMVRRR